MKKERKHYTAEEKVAVLRRHLLDKVPVSDLCEELGLQPTVFYRWQKEFFENGASAFQSTERPHRQVEEKQKRIEYLERTMCGMRWWISSGAGRRRPRSASGASFHGWAFGPASSTTGGQRYGRVNEHNGWIPRDFWLEAWE